MNLTRTSYIRLLRIILATVVILVILAYAIWRSLNYARGPAITILSPLDGSTIDTQTTEIKGRVDRINNLTLNGNPISIDLSGNFDQTVIVFPGTNILTFSASDQFGRSTETRLNLYGTATWKNLSPAPASTSGTASSSATTSTSSKP